MKKTVAFGEIMLRLCAEGHKRFAQAAAFGVHCAGAEANVAVALSQMGAPARFVTALPDNGLGRMALNELNKCGVDTSCVAAGDGRMGLMFMEKGAGQRPSVAIYDRAGSAFARAEAKAFDFDKAFGGAGWFHVTGITPAVSETAAAAALAAVKRAKEKGLSVSFDVNYRPKLWSVEKAAGALPEIAARADVVIGTDWDAQNIFGAGDARDLAEKYGLKAVAHAVRGADGAYSGVLYKDGGAYASKRHALAAVDRIGAGDAFAAGLIYAFLNGFEPRRAIEFAAAAGALNHTVEGDFNLASAAEIQAAADGAGGGVRR
jgi:2-dehydro-3-deoxygluconokinase